MPDRTSKHRLTGVLVRAAGRHAGRSRLEDLDVLRSGATPRLFDDLRAPSTVGSWLRAFTCGHVRQLDALSRALRTRLWAVGAGPKQLAGPLIVDVDSTICPTWPVRNIGTETGANDDLAMV